MRPFSRLESTHCRTSRRIPSLHPPQIRSAEGVGFDSRLVIQGGLRREQTSSARSGYAQDGTNTSGGCLAATPSTPAVPPSLCCTHPTACSEKWLCDATLLPSICAISSGWGVSAVARRKAHRDAVIQCGPGESTPRNTMGGRPRHTPSVPPTPTPRRTPRGGLAAFGWWLRRASNPKWRVPGAATVGLVMTAARCVTPTSSVLSCGLAQSHHPNLAHLLLCHYRSATGLCIMAGDGEAERGRAGGTDGALFPLRRVPLLLSQLSLPNGETLGLPRAATASAGGG